MSNDHFKGKEALGHVAEAQAKGILSAAEIHGTEIPGHLSAACDAAREIAIFLLILSFFTLSLPFLIIFTLSFLVWKGGRSAWLGWFRLERMHRIVDQERWEIKHHRKQEREELKELYRTKGFEGKLLEEVLDVLMADDERLLKVMVEEELFLTVGNFEHPLKQAAGAIIGTTLGALFCLISFYLFPDYGLWVSSFLTVAAAASLSTYYEGNKIIPAIVWNLGLAVLAVGTAYFLLEII